MDEPGVFRFFYATKRQPGVAGGTVENHFSAEREEKLKFGAFDTKIEVLLHQGKTPILTPNEARRLIRSIPTDTVTGLRDGALIGLMIYTFARVSAAVQMDVKDVYPKQESLWVFLDICDCGSHLRP